MAFKDIILLLHPVLAIAVTFPLLGLVVNRALQVRQRRLQPAGEKSKIPPTVGQEHVQIGNWLASSVVGITLIAFAHGIFNNAAEKQLWTKMPLQMATIIGFFGVTIATFYLLFKARQRRWRALFATLSGIGLVVLGCQDGIYRKTDQWYISHYYYGITAALLMIVSVAIVQTIYKDRSHRWRKAHIVLNSIALLLFFGQAFTGTLSLLEIPLGWQKSYVQQLYEQQCEAKPCKVEAVSAPNVR